jgi:AGZA family xanthine/uracil permease-like MFS transporter
MTSPIAGRIARYFELERFGTTIGTEVLAGASTYLSLAYIFIVNPSILAQAGIDPKSALFATAVVATLATLAMGLWANLPFAVAPGLTMNSYFVFVVCKKMHFTWQQGLATVCVSGIVCVVLTALPLRQAIIDSIPVGLKRAITVTLGIFIATIGLFISKVISFGPGGFIDLSAFDTAHFTGPLAQVMLLGLVVSIVLGWQRLHFPAGMLVAILLSSLLYHKLLGGSAAPAQSGGSVLASFGRLDFSVFFHSQFWLPVIVFFVLDFFEGIGEFIGMTSNTTIQDKDGNVPNIKQGLWIDGLGTITGSVFGTSSLIIFVESAVGIKAGGRTGLTAVVCALLMMLGVWASFYFSPILTLIPAQAAAGVLVYVGYLLLSGSVESLKDGSLSPLDITVTLAMGVISFLTFSLDKSLVFGFWAYFIASFIPGRAEKPAWWLGAIAAALTAALAFSG